MTLLRLSDSFTPVIMLQIKCTSFIFSTAFSFGCRICCSRLSAGSVCSDRLLSRLASPPCRVSSLCCQAEERRYYTRRQRTRLNIFTSAIISSGSFLSAALWTQWSISGIRASAVWARQIESDLKSWEVSYADRKYFPPASALNALRVAGPSYKSYREAGAPLEKLIFIIPISHTLCFSNLAGVFLGRLIIFQKVSCGGKKGLWCEWCNSV